ncbi:hypothetical protein JTB14_036937 [Gonioctena quinquepunctata]|nr:hypothetical protein JTB14_036937 [Gonioctena quinquepunctata]
MHQPSLQLHQPMQQQQHNLYIPASNTIMVSTTNLQSTVPDSNHNLFEYGNSHQPSSNLNSAAMFNIEQHHEAFGQDLNQYNGEDWSYPDQ